LAYPAVMSYVRARAGARAVSLAALALLGCKRHLPEPAATPIEDGGEQVVEIAGTDAGPDASPEESAPHMIALSSPTPIFSAPEWPPRDPSKATEERVGVIRLGSLRKGQSVPVKRELVKKSSCLEGWYELLQGGFVCGKYGTLDPNDKALANAPHAPLTEGPLPYEYGLNLTNGTPLYRRAPLRSERAKLESLLAVGKNAKVVAPTDGETPWYLKPHEGDRPTVSLGDLRGENNLIEQRMVRGFYLALDSEIKAFSGKFWRTTRGMLAPADHILVHKPTTEFEGVKLDDPAETRKLPLGFVTGLHARRYTLEETRVRRGEHVDRFTIVGLTGKKELREERTYYETTDGWWLRDFDGNVTRPGPPPPDLKPGEKWIDVNLTRQSLVAFEGEKPVYATLISSGRHDDNDKSKDHRTPMGSFAIREKHVSATMDDDSASDGPYSIEDVPWIMYFKGGIALHGAFWHSRFGHERSHGCVNLTPHDAKHLFEWAGPTLPPGWHGVHATDANPGTRVIVHD
jgi:hypothetical protein